MKYALITGASSGCGYEYARILAQKGYNLLIVSNEDAIHDKADLLRQEYPVKVISLVRNLGVQEAAKELYDYCYTNGIEVEVLINNAGGALQIPKGEFEDMPLDYWDSQIALNLNACAYCAHAAVQNMKANNIPGRIVNISSVHGSVTWVKRKMLPYCAAKAGLDMFTKSLGVEVAPYGIRVNGIAPGLIMTKLADRYKPEHLDGFLNKIPVGFLGQTDHIVPAIMFLSDIESTEYIVGQVLTVDGGQAISGTIPAMKEDFER